MDPSTVGIGAEVAVADNVSIGLAYNYNDFGDVETEGAADSQAAEGTGTAYYYKSEHVTQQTVSVDLNYHFQ